MGGSASGDAGSRRRGHASRVICERKLGAVYTHVRRRIARGDDRRSKAVKSGGVDEMDRDVSEARRCREVGAVMP